MSNRKSRRDFLKTAAGAAAGLAVTGILPQKASAATAAWQSGVTKINPAIDNFRVVGCYDKKMVKSTTQLPTDLATQNGLVDATAVANNMDQMAKYLINNPSATADLAWNTIFQLPSGKALTNVKVLIKINCINSMQQPRPAIVAKVCKELIRIGIPAANITLYDGKTPPASTYGSGILPANVKVSTVGPGGDPSVPVPGANGQTTSLPCTSNLAASTNGTITYKADILINVAVNKGHSQTDKGGPTLTMKNHTGTLKLSCPSDAGEMCRENQSEAVIGGTNGAPCRQQLCIIDSLWSSKTGPGESPSDVTARLTMGTLGPVVDYLTTKKIRNEIMHMDTASGSGATQADIWVTILTAFGYSDSTVVWVDVPPASSTAALTAPSAHGLECEVGLASSGWLAQSLHFTVPPGEGIPHIEIHDLRGRLVRRGVANFAGGRYGFAWDGKTESGAAAVAGSYVVRLSAGNFRKSGTLAVPR